ncbi:MAG: hypothetical protein ACXVB9_07875 [Bdellovibrionota bacterium]
MVNFEILKGLPPEGSLPLSFSRGGGVLHAEGFVVKFFPGESREWVGNFAPGISPFSTAIAHPDQRRVLVIAGGQGYVIDAEKRKLDGVLGGGICEVLPAPGIEGVIFSGGLALEAYGASGSLWKSPRISWDGIKDLRITGPEIHGKSYAPFPLSGMWSDFRIDLATGELLEGGSYAE